MGLFISEVQMKTLLEEFYEEMQAIGEDDVVEPKKTDDAHDPGAKLLGPMDLGLLRLFTMMSHRGKEYDALMQIAEASTDETVVRQAAQDCVRLLTERESLNALMWQTIMKRHYVEAIWLFISGREIYYLDCVNCATKMTCTRYLQELVEQSRGALGALMGNEGLDLSDLDIDLDDEADEQAGDDSATDDEPPDDDVLPDDDTDDDPTKVN